jgi:hypothetical protein
MREGDREYFYRKLDEHFPGMKQRYIQTYGNSYECKSPNNARLWDIYRDVCRRNGILYKSSDVFKDMGKVETDGRQMSMF